MYYKKGDHPGSWSTCPLGRICKEANKPEGADSIKELLGKSERWVGGYIDGFDSMQGSYVDYSSSDYLEGLQMGQQDRKAYILSMKEVQ